MPLLGAHVSASGGLYKAFENAARLGAETIQIFGASPRQWSAQLPSKDAVDAFKKAWEASDVQAVYLHAAYLVNLAAHTAESRKKSIASLTAHLTIAKRIGAHGLIFHMGSANGGSREKALSDTAEGMKEVLEAVSGSTRLLMENSAGGGNKLCSDIDELAWIARRVGSSRVGVCFDTAHGFEAGALEDFSPANIAAVLRKWNEKLGPHRIEVVHCNDSKSPANSHHDRHENIGEGHIGLAGFKALAKEKSLHECAWILEVPGFDGNGPDKENLEILKGCF